MLQELTHICRFVVNSDFNNFATRGNLKIYPQNFLLLELFLETMTKHYSLSVGVRNNQRPYIFILLNAL